MSEQAPKKSLGQHWLYDAAALEAMCAAGDLTPDDTILEIGPGTGSLTRKLVQRVKQVVAVEFDARLAAKLAAEYTAPNLKIVTQDILTFDLTSLPPNYKVVANIPYYLTSKLVRVLSETSNAPQRVVILVQKEVAQRVAAKAGDMSLLSVSAQFYWEVTLDRIVEAGLFTPPPKVDSQILIMTSREQPLFPDIVTKKFFQLVKAGFSARRKTLLNSLSGGLRVDKVVIEKLLVTAAISSTTRAQVLSLSQWHDLYQAAQTENIL